MILNDIAGKKITFVTLIGYNTEGKIRLEQQYQIIYVWYTEKYSSVYMQLI